MLTNGVLSYTWDAENRLTSVYSNDTLLVSNVYDHQSRRIAKIVSHGGTEAQRRNFVYDSWNLIQELITDNGSLTTNSFTWGLDLSGTLQGAGGVGGLLAVHRNSAVYFPRFDANGNVTEYLDASGSIRAHYAFDAFGNTSSQSGDLASTFSHRFSAKYADDEAGLYYYGFRYYSPELGRWVNRDPIEEMGGMNLYGFCDNDAVNFIDVFGLWKKGETIEDGARRVYYYDSSSDTMSSLANIVGLEAKESDFWANFYQSPYREDECGYSVPNVWIAADLLHGGGPYSRLVNFGGTSGVFFGTDMFTSGDYKIEKVTTVGDLVMSLTRNQGNVWGMAVFGHGNIPDGRVLLQSGLSKDSIRNGQYVCWIYQEDLINIVAQNNYKLSKIYMMQCFSAYVGPKYDWKSKWEERAKTFFGYQGTNACMLDFGWAIWPWNWF